MKYDRVYTCEEHFAPEDIEICRYDTYNSFDFRLYTTQYTLTSVCLNLKLEGIPILTWPYFSTYSYLCENDQEKVAIWCITDIEYAQKESRNGETSAKTCSISACKRLEHQYM